MLIKNIYKPLCILLMLYLKTISCIDDDRNSLSNNTGSDTLTIQEYQKWYAAHNLPHDDDIPKDQQDTSLSAEFQGIDSCGDDEGEDTNLEVITAKRRTKSMVDECALHGEDQQTLMAECRACNIRLKPQVSDGVYLTCFECHSMPVDQTCKLGVHQKMSPALVYRVFCKVFTTGENQEHYFTSPIYNGVGRHYDNQMNTSP